MSQLTLDSAILETILERATSAARLVGYIDEPAVDTVVRPLADNIDEIVHTVTELLGNPHLIAAPVPSARSTFAPDIVARDNFATRVGGPESVALDARDDEARRARLRPIDRAILEILHKRAASVAHRASYIEDPEQLSDDIDAIVHELSELLGNACPKFEADDVPAASCTPLLSLPTADERSDELAPALDPPGFVAASTTDEPMRPRVRRLRTIHGRPRHRAGQAATRQAGAARVPTIEESRLPIGWVRGATITALIALLGVIAILSACIATGGAR